MVDPVGESTLGSLGLTDGDAVPGIEVEVDLGSPRLLFSSISSGAAGTGVLASQFELLDDSGGFGTEFVRFEPGTQLASVLELAVHRALLLFDVADTESFDAAVGFGAEALDGRGSFTGQAGLYDPGGQIGPIQERSARIDSLLTLPIIAATVEQDVGPLRLGGEVRWVQGSSGAKEASVLSYDVRARFGPWRFFDAVIGYRANRTDISYQSGGQSAVVDVQLSGPYVGFGLSF